MTTVRSDAACQQLRLTGTYLMSPAETAEHLGIGRDEWRRFGEHWENLAPDVYASELGTRRLRRYGHVLFSAADSSLIPMPHEAFVQPEASNPLYAERERRFEPLTESFAGDFVLRAVVNLLGHCAASLDEAGRWSVKITPFRVLASASEPGQPTPEGVHRDGVTLVAALLVGRDNAVGGESSVFDMAGRRLLATTLQEPGALLIGDDRRTKHAVSPIQPRDPATLARRDVLVVTFAPVTSVHDQRR